MVSVVFSGLPGGGFLAGAARLLRQLPSPHGVPGPRPRVLDDCFGRSCQRLCIPPLGSVLLTGPPNV